MTDVDTKEQIEVVETRFKDRLPITSGRSFKIGSKYGINRAAIGRNPWHEGAPVLEGASEDTTGVELADTKAMPGLTSRLQLVVGRDKEGTFYIENMSQYIKGKKKGVPMKVIAPHLEGEIPLPPKGKTESESDTKCLLGGTAGAFNDVIVLWGEYKGDPVYKVIVEDASEDSEEGWEATIKYKAWEKE